MQYRIISIGTLSDHELWSKKMPPRTAHATTTLILTEDRRMLVDPALPGEVLGARLNERAGLNIGDITDIFLTAFRPAHRWGLKAFQDANWLIAESEREAMGQALVEQFQQEQGEEQKAALREEIALLKRCKSAPDKLAQGVDLFPIPGFTPGTCGLLLSLPQATVLIAGDAVATEDHFIQGRVLKGAWDATQAKESFAEVMEIADVIVPGHGNVIFNLTRSAMAMGAQ